MGEPFNLVQLLILGAKYLVQLLIVGAISLLILRQLRARDNRKRWAVGMLPLGSLPVLSLFWIRIPFGDLGYLGNGQFLIMGNMFPSLWAYKFTGGLSVAPLLDVLLNSGLVLMLARMSRVPFRVGLVTGLSGSVLMWGLWLLLDRVNDANETVAVAFLFFAIPIAFALYPLAALAATRTGRLPSAPRVTAPQRTGVGMDSPGAAHRIRIEEQRQRTAAMQVKVRLWNQEGFLVPLKEVLAMADTVGLEALVKDLEGRVARLRALARALGELDTTEFPAEVEALRALLKDPGQVEEAERRLGELKALIQREGQRRRARRLFEEGVSQGQRGGAFLEEGRYSEAITSLGEALRCFRESQEALGPADPRFLGVIGSNEQATTANLFSARVGLVMEGAKEGEALYEKEAFDEAEAAFRKAHTGVEGVLTEAHAKGLARVEEEATRHLGELAQNIEGCIVAKDAQRVDELVGQCNARWEEAEQAITQNDLPGAKDILNEAVEPLKEAFDTATRRRFQDNLPRINQLRERVQSRLDEVYRALERGVSEVPHRLPPIPLVPPRRPKLGLEGAGPIPGDPYGPMAASWKEVYEIVEFKDKGGSAEVYLARRKQGGHQVALKAPIGAVDGKINLLDRASQKLFEDFRQEAQNWKRLDHPHIVRLLDYGQRPYPWLVMEYMPGGSLRDRLGSLSTTETLVIMCSMCGAVEHAHTAGFVHRDIKPHNILFTEAGVAKLSDWGLARHALYHSISAGYSGTALYSSPEQIMPDRFGQHGHAGDVFQLGIVLYEAITGRNPFLKAGEAPEDMSEYVVWDRIVGRAGPAFSIAPPSSLRPDLPVALDGILLAVLNRQLRERRFREAWMLREALEDVLAPSLQGPGNPLRRLSATVSYRDMGTLYDTWRWGERFQATPADPLLLAQFREYYTSNQHKFDLMLKVMQGELDFQRQHDILAREDLAAGYVKTLDTIAGMVRDLAPRNPS